VGVLPVLPTMCRRLYCIDRADNDVNKLSTLDRLLPVWILARCCSGSRRSRDPRLGTVIDAVAVEGISLPIALGLLIMMYRCWPRSATTS